MVAVNIFIINIFIASSLYGQTKERLGLWVGKEEGAFRGWEGLLTTMPSDPLRVGRSGPEEGGCIRAFSYLSSIYCTTNIAPFYSSKARLAKTSFNLILDLLVLCVTNLLCNNRSIGKYSCAG